MAAYVIVDVAISDPAGYEEYRRAAPQSVAAYGGRFLARGGRAEALEGEWRPRRVVVLEFDSVERARAWWASEEYRGAKEVRQRTAATNMIVVEGL